MTVIADNARRAKLGSNNVLVRARKQNDKMSVLISQLKTPSLYLRFYRFIEHLLDDLVKKEHILWVCVIFICSFNCSSSMFPYWRRKSKPKLPSKLSSQIRFGIVTIIVVKHFFYLNNFISYFVHALIFSLMGVKIVLLSTRGHPSLIEM